MSAADTGWIMTATALVLFMTLPGLALFYGGLVRQKNVLSVMMQCVSIACLGSLLWLLIGYSDAGKSGNVATSLPASADVFVSCVPANCMPSPESPQKRTVAASTSTSGL